MKLSQMFIERLRALELNSRGKIYTHRLDEQLTAAQAFATKTEKDGEAIIYLFPDRSRLRVDNPAQRNDRATFFQLSNVG